MRAGISREAAFGVGAVGSDKRCGIGTTMELPE
jgi:hypothetical protein